MNHPLAAVQPVTRSRAALETFPAPGPTPGPEEAFAPQLARACERTLPSALTAPTRSELSPVSDLAEATSRRPWETPFVEDTPSAEPGADADADSAAGEENQSRSAEEEALEPSASPDPPATTPLVALSPLALRLAALAAAKAAEGEASATVPETPPDAVAQETTIPGSSRVGPATKPAAKVGEVPSATPAATSAAAAPALAGGTSVASLAPEMNVAQDMTKTTGPADLPEQNLPTGSATAQVLAERAGTRSASLSHTTPATEAASALTAFVRPAAEAAPASEKLTPVAPVDPTAKLVALMASAVVQLRQTGADDFEVAIQPDPNTEIVLRVTLQGEGAEIHAELRRGDSAAFAARWQELQERLAQQGVKLAALTAGQPDAGSLGHGSEFSSPQREPEPEGESDPFSITTATTTHTQRPAATQPERGRGWETWA
jgi:hypothetical protein